MTGVVAQAAVAAGTITTATETALAIDPDRITLAMPDAQGLVTITAPPGTLPPAGATVLIATLRCRVFCLSRPHRGQWAVT